MWSLPQVVQLYHRRRGGHCRGHPESQSPTVGTGMLLWVNYGQHELSRMERVSSCLVGMMLTPHLDSRNIPRLSSRAMVMVSWCHGMVTMVTSPWSLQDAAALLTTLEEKPKSLSCVPLQSCPDVPDLGWRRGVGVSINGSPTGVGQKGKILLR